MDDGISGKFDLTSPTPLNSRGPSDPGQAETEPHHSPPKISSGWFARSMMHLGFYAESRKALGRQYDAMVADVAREYGERAAAHVRYTQRGSIPPRVTPEVRKEALAIAQDFVARHPEEATAAFDARRPELENFISLARYRGRVELERGQGIRARGKLSDWKLFWMEKGLYKTSRANIETSFSAFLQRVADRYGSDAAAHAGFVMRRKGISSLTLNRINMERTLTAAQKFVGSGDSIGNEHGFDVFVWPYQTTSNIGHAACQLRAPGSRNTRYLSLWPDSNTKRIGMLKLKGGHLSSSKASDMQSELGAKPGLYLSMRPRVIEYYDLKEQGLHKGAEAQKAALLVDLKAGFQESGLPEKDLSDPEKLFREILAYSPRPNQVKVDRQGHYGTQPDRISLPVIGETKDERGLRKRVLFGLNQRNIHEAFDQAQQDDEREKLPYKGVSQDRNCAAFVMQVLKAGGSEFFEPMTSASFFEDPSRASSYATRVQQRADTLNQQVEDIEAVLDGIHRDQYLAPQHPELEGQQAGLISGLRIDEEAGPNHAYVRERFREILGILESETTQPALDHANRLIMDDKLPRSGDRPVENSRPPYLNLGLLKGISAIYDEFIEAENSERSSEQLQESCRKIVENLHAFLSVDVPSFEQEYLNGDSPDDAKEAWSHCVKEAVVCANAILDRVADRLLEQAEPQQSRSRASTDVSTIDTMELLNTDY